MFHRVTAATVTGLLSLGLTASPAFADSTAPDPTTSVSVDGDQVTITTDLATVQQLCTKAERALTRLDNAHTRLTADGSTEGSIAWAYAQQDAAETAGKTNLADRWQLVIDRRERRLPMVEEAQGSIQNAYDTVCTVIPETNS